MPLFDFKCAACGHIEKDVIIGKFGMEHELKFECPACGGPMEKLISQFTFRMGRGDANRVTAPGKSSMIRMGK